MRDFGILPRLYVVESLVAGGCINLDQSQAHYLGTVLRKVEGDKIRVFADGAGEWLAELSSLSKRRVEITVLEQLRTASAGPDIWLLFAPIKKTRNSFIVEKATELGIALLQPVITARTTSKIRMDKMSAQIIEAAEQTERLDLPQIRDPLKLQTLLDEWDAGRRLVFADEAGDAAPAVQALASIKAPCAILIGPEGGFTPEERALLRSKPFVTPISLGPRILRADTAALATLSLWQAVSGDW
ncbi:MAG: 16S rRNA (uracil(1498)-N(3))-methyltransferase [Robiginitomaculum sp.]|nr:MAG: 16S rRNA (uracil(1498)-N(3))-methyltransferase [Robiginitomaculum sp.]